jgi:hypothetical protein
MQLQHRKLSPAVRKLSKSKVGSFNILARTCPRVCKLGSDQAKARDQLVPAGHVLYQEQLVSLLTKFKVPCAVTESGDEEGIRDISSRMGLRTGGAMTPKGLLVHHTSGREAGPERVEAVLRERIDLDGTITRIAPEGRTAFHAGRLEKSGGKWGNFNMEGVEVIARNEKDVNPEQREAVAKLVGMRSRKFGYDPRTNVSGHCELTRRKETDEGRTAQYIRRGLLDDALKARLLVPRSTVKSASIYG